MIKNGTLWACLLLASVSFADKYTAKTGETLAQIAKKKGISLETLRQANPKLDSSALKNGQVVVIPPKGVSTNGQHKLKPGEDVWDVAKHYGTTLSSLKALNPGIDLTKVKAGSFIEVPVLDTKFKPVVVKDAQSFGKTTTYTATKFDTDWIIASRHRISSADLKTLNPTVDLTAIEEGTVLTVPVVKTESNFKVKDPSKVVAKTSTIFTPESKVVRIKGDNVRVRSTPSTEAISIDMLNQGTIGKVVEKKNNWLRLEFASNVSGWVRADFVEGSNAKFSAVASKPKQVAYAKPAPTRNQTGLIGTAYSFVGVRYVYGGTSRSGIDCSAFVGAVYRKNGINLPRTAAEQSQRGQFVSKSELKAGDLIFFRTGRSYRINHVAMYIGGGNMIHASSGGGMVRVDSFNKDYYQRNYATSRRIANFGSSKVTFIYKPNDDQPDIKIDDDIVLEDPIEPTRNVGTDTIGG